VPYELIFQDLHSRKDTATRHEFLIPPSQHNKV
jgi:hypothetical protein